eukprot:COSAG03_NODE_4079_length_1696_cov_1.083281_2_plen_128_part_00
MLRAMDVSAGRGARCKTRETQVCSLLYMAPCLCDAALGSALRDGLRRSGRQAGGAVVALAPEGTVAVQVAVFPFEVGEVAIAAFDVAGHVGPAVDTEASPHPPSYTTSWWRSCRWCCTSGATHDHGP